jgi:hypothetical protein
VWGGAGLIRPLSPAIILEIEKVALSFGPLFWERINQKGKSAFE